VIGQSAVSNISADNKRPDQRNKYGIAL
jgi:hypothetical protein